MKNSTLHRTLLCRILTSYQLDLAIDRDNIAKHLLPTISLFYTDLLLIVYLDCFLLNIYMINFIFNCLVVIFDCVFHNCNIIFSGYLGHYGDLQWPLWLLH